MNDLKMPVSEQMMQRMRWLVGRRIDRVSCDVRDGDEWAVLTLDNGQMVMIPNSTWVFVDPEVM